MSGARQQGLALVSVLLVMALLTLLVAGMLRSQQLLVAGVSQQLDFQRLTQMALAGERLALRQLASQAPALLQRSHGGQEWAREQSLALGGGQLGVRIDDLAGRLNIAALIGQESLDPVLLARWQSLCQSLDIDPPPLEGLVGQRLLDVSQLRAVPGLNDAALQRLRPWLAALPAKAGLNINSASPRLLATLEGVSPAIARQLPGERPADGHASVQGFLASPLMAGLGTQARGLATGSRWYVVELAAQWEEQRLYLYSDLEIDAKTHRVSVVRRRFTTLREPQRDE